VGLLFVSIAITRTLLSSCTLSPKHSSPRWWDDHLEAIWSALIWPEIQALSRSL